MSGRNATADRARLLQLAREEPSAGVLPMGQNVMSPNLAWDNEGNPIADFIFRTGINLPMGDHIVSGCSTTLDPPDGRLRIAPPHSCATWTSLP
ncbi:hypothetical protein O1Q96_17355 [Streptomyces sp. Qhu-G9]|uniref:hypothetical protein n=1 Tax=Streptomyces sp. Qhu-G9 TaxID=3452799 RepID=UPI0022AC84C9|nr:hypothetical protein [Streptomyces aurantiacus]WAU81397.1 hypothetical protein O1Q96_17355 [Streptomyces aurantiacus]